MSTHSRQIGQLGERIAANWLENKGFDIVDANYRRKWGELDLVGLKDKRVYFFEVKSVQRRLQKDREVKSEEKYRPAENMHDAKIQRIYRAAQTWLEENNLTDTDWQIDFLAVRIDFNTRRSSIHRVKCIS